jgi:hypothetical protein
MIGSFLADANLSLETGRLNRLSPTEQGCIVFAIE